MEFFKPLFGCFNAIDFLGTLGLKAYNFIKKRLRHRCFPVNIAKFLSTPILKNICKRLLLWMCVLWTPLVKVASLPSLFRFSFIFDILADEERTHKVQCIICFIIMFNYFKMNCISCLTLSWRGSISYRNQSKSIRWFLYDMDLDLL